MPNEEQESDTCEECGDLTDQQVIVACGHHIYLCQPCQEEMVNVEPITCHWCELTDYDLPFTD